MPQIPDAAADQLGSSDLISFLKAIPDGRYRRGVRYPQWFLLLVAVLGILSGSRSSRDLEAFAKRHRQELNQGLLKKLPASCLDFSQETWVQEAR
ncbi:transposase family protein [Cyanobium sp. ATX 6E8]|uniref:transposase family protein n=1 Tax=Cyanobium sp. ATX 6E8 TaxID=2823701 RepID=UPI0020CDCD41|nr:transposase family protein [Cyanobium sp. ATX 6E8]MCP9943538.1 transposase family protein [Cyanobium sp. ATX 6E8]